MSAKALVASLPILVAAVPGLAGTSECGTASWYDQEGTKTASGGVVDPDTLTAAHPSLPFGTKVKVENLDNGKSTIVEIDDRGPFTAGRIIDVSRAAAERLDFIGDGLTSVRVSKANSSHSAEKSCR